MVTGLDILTTGAAGHRLIQGSSSLCASSADMGEKFSASITSALKSCSFK